MNGGAERRRHQHDLPLEGAWLLLDCVQAERPQQPAPHIALLGDVIMSDKPHFSILTLTFASEGDLRIWRDKVEMFSSDKAVEYLKKMANEADDHRDKRERHHKRCRHLGIWNEESRETCQVYWSKWYEFDGKFISKSTFVCEKPWVVAKPNRRRFPISEGIIFGQHHNQPILSIDPRQSSTRDTGSPRA